MPWSSSLKARKIESRIAVGKAPWCVNVPAELSETGKRQRRFFDTEREAKAECETLKARRDNFGNSLVAMTPARIAEAVEAYKLLDPHSVGLLDAVRSHLQVISERAASVTFGAAFERFAELKQTKSAKYQQEIRQTKAKFEP
jgi:hypothetical protein